MKRIYILLLVLFTVPLYAQPSGPPEYSAPADYPVNTADISAIEFNTESGLLFFTVKGQRFVYFGGSPPHNNPAADVAAGFATLAELRRATTATLRVEFVNDRVNASKVDGITFHYDTLRP